MPAKIQADYKSGGYPNEDLVRLFEELSALHLRATAVLKAHEAEVKKPGGTLEDLVDTAWILRKSAERAEDVRKMLGRLEREIVNRVGLRWTQQAVAEDDDSPVRGQLATGSPDVKEVPRFPSRSAEPEAYSEALQAVGVPRKLADSGVVVFHYKNLGDFNADLQKAGLSMPALFKDYGEPYTEYSLRLTPARGNPFV